MRFNVRLAFNKLSHYNSSPHLWIIIALIVLITIYYYNWHSMLDWFRPSLFFLLLELRSNILGSLFIIPFIYAAIAFRTRGALSVYVITKLLSLPYILSLDELLSISIVFNILYSLVPLLIVILIYSELDWRANIKKVMIAREEERKAYTSQIYKAQESERKRIACELHDDITQMLMVVVHDIKNLLMYEVTKTSQQLMTKLDKIKSEIINIANNVRRLSLDMRPSILDDIGLVSAIEWLVRQLNECGTVRYEVVVIGVEHRLEPNDIELNIFRIVQEALTNVRRHSQATNALVTFHFDLDRLRIYIRDNGKGFELKNEVQSLAIEGKLGLISIRQRAEFMKGTLDIESRLGQGTTISLEKKY